MHSHLMLLLRLLMLLQSLLLCQRILLMLLSLLLNFRPLILLHPRLPCNPTDGPANVEDLVIGDLVQLCDHFTCHLDGIVVH